MQQIYSDYPCNGKIMGSFPPTLHSLPLIFLSRPMDSLRKENMPVEALQSEDSAGSLVGFNPVINPVSKSVYVSVICRDNNK